MNSLTVVKSFIIYSTLLLQINIVLEKTSFLIIVFKSYVICSAVANHTNANFNSICNLSSDRDTTTGIVCLAITLGFSLKCFLHDITMHCPLLDKIKSNFAIVDLRFYSLSFTAASSNVSVKYCLQGHNWMRCAYCTVNFFIVYVTICLERQKCKQYVEVFCTWVSQSG